MMLTALLLALAPPAQPAEDPIVIVARRLHSLTINVGQDPKGNLTCSLSASSGVARIDDKLCRGAADCVRRAAKKKLPAGSVERCITGTKEKALAAYKRERLAR